MAGTKIMIERWMVDWWSFPRDFVGSALVVFLDGPLACCWKKGTSVPEKGLNLNHFGNRTTEPFNQMRW
jgi:hypothetical protein